MNMLTQSRAERLIAKRYEEHGYVVIPEPPVSAIPFSLGKYKPDILAVKDGEHVLVEVKSPGARVNSDIYFWVDRQVQQHPGWRFMLVTVAEDELRKANEIEIEGPTIQLIQQRLDRLRAWLETPDSPGVLFPQLWVAFASALRHLAKREGVETDGLTDLSLINKTYSEGLTSIDEATSAKRFLKLRNESVHSLDPHIEKKDCEELYQMTETILRRLQ